jgi:hypothetical protein
LTLASGDISALPPCWQDKSSDYTDCFGRLSTTWGNNADYEYIGEIKDAAPHGWGEKKLIRSGRKQAGVWENGIFQFERSKAEHEDLNGRVAEAEEIFSCKQVADANVGSESSSGSALYGDSEFDRQFLGQKDPELLRISETKQMIMEGKKYLWVGWSGLSALYANDYGGLVEVYDRKKDEFTLFITRSNGNNSQKSNRLKVELWHCNK